MAIFFMILNLFSQGEWSVYAIQEFLDLKKQY